MDTMPDFTFETNFGAPNGKLICGVDEVGRGCLAGGTTSAAVILDPKNIPDGLNDSKKLTRRCREQLFEAIIASSHVSFASISAREIDSTNIRLASLKAMTQAVHGLSVNPDHVLVDGNVIPPELRIPATYIIKGDSKSLSIAAASIIAKVIRDRTLERAHKYWPGYGFNKNAGYGTKQHLDTLVAIGPSPIHRLSFKPLRVS